MALRTTPLDSGLSNRVCYALHPMAQQVLATHLPPHPGPFLDEEDMPESTLHDQCLTLLCAILSHWTQRSALDALVARNLACRWDASDVRIGVDPDLLLTSPHPPLPPGRRSLKQLRLWEPGHAPPRITIEVVSESTAKKDYEEAARAQRDAEARTQQEAKARQDAEKELQELRRRLAELEALARPPSAGGGAPP